MNGDIIDREPQTDFFYDEVKGGYYVLANRQDRANHKDPTTAFYSKSKKLWLESK